MRFEILKKRAEKYYKYARRFFEEGDYDSAAFYIEQTIQFFLKYLLLKETGFFPRIHDLDILFRSAGKIHKELLDFYEKHKDVLWEIYYAYTNSRYGEKEYPKEIVEKFLKVLEEFYNLIKKWI